jgi:hypothetical protein
VTKPFSAASRHGAAVTRTRLLRVGYAALGLTFVALAATFSPVGQAFLALGLLVGFVGAGALMLSGDHLARWAGIAIVAYFLLCALAFIGSNGATIRVGDTIIFFNDAPSPFFDALFDYLVLGITFLFTAAALVAVWEVGAPRWLLVGATGGFVLLAILTVAITPDAGSLDGGGESRSLAALFALFALVGAAGAFWASARPVEA